MRHGENHVITGAAIVVWDGITKPETIKNGQPLPKPKYSLKLALQPGDPCIKEIEAIATAALQASKFKGVMPHGGSWPLSACNPQIADGALAGLIAINPKTDNGDIVQKVYDANGQLLNPMTYSRMLYPGAKIEVILHAYAFDNVQKGIALGLDGIRIVDAQSPALNIGASMGAAEVGSIFATVPVTPGAVQPGYQVPGVPPMPGPPAGMYPQPGVLPTPGVPPIGMYSQPGAIGGYQAPGVPPAGPMPLIQPAPEFLQPAPGAAGMYPQPGYQAPPAPGQFAPPLPAVVVQHQMTAAAGGASYEQMIAVGWNDVTLRQHGMML